jgi:hypothetical protein
MKKISMTIGKVPGTYEAEKRSYRCGAKAALPEAFLK